jgi:hypothetical protein
MVSFAFPGSHLPTLLSKIYQHSNPQEGVETPVELETDLISDVSFVQPSPSPAVPQSI